VAYNYAREAAKARKWAANEEKRKERERRRAEAQERRNRGRIAGAIITGAIGAYGATTNLPQTGSAPLRDEARSSAQEERTSRARTQRGATRDQGNHNRGSGRS
jgi:hypothetical protein